MLVWRPAVGVRALGTATLCHTIRTTVVDQDFRICWYIPKSPNPSNWLLSTAAVHDGAVNAFETTRVIGERSDFGNAGRCTVRRSEILNSSSAGRYSPYVVVRPSIRSLHIPHSKNGQECSRPYLHRGVQPPLLRQPFAPANFHRLRTDTVIATRDHTVGTRKLRPHALFVDSAAYIFVRVMSEEENMWVCQRFENTTDSVVYQMPHTVNVGD